MYRRRSFAAAVLATAIVTAATAVAQQEFFRGFGRRGRAALTHAARERTERREPQRLLGRGEERGIETANVQYDGRFVFVRLRYNLGMRGGRGGWDAPWAHDYPRADRNVMKILKEITYVSPSMESKVMGLDDPELGNFPVAYMSEPGFWTLTETGAEVVWFPDASRARADMTCAPFATVLLSHEIV